MKLLGHGSEPGSIVIELTHAEAAMLQRFTASLIGESFWGCPWEAYGDMSDRVRAYVMDNRSCLRCLAYQDEKSIKPPEKEFQWQG